VRVLQGCTALALAGMTGLAGVSTPAEGASPRPVPPKTKPVVVRKLKPVRSLGSRSWRVRTPSSAVEARGIYTVERQGSGVYYRKGIVLGVGINVIEADLEDDEVRVAAMVSEGGIGTAERFGRMVRRAQPAAAITGTFFGIRNRIPTGDLVINGKSVFRGFIGTAVAITEGNVVSFIPTTYKGEAVDWSLYDTVIRGGPRLVDRGAIAVAARQEGFLTLPISRRRTRTAVGLTHDNQLQFVAVRQAITLWELAKVMRAIGAYHAVALDGGTSTALYFAGRYVANPSRGLTNVLLIYHRKSRYEEVKPLLLGPYSEPPAPVTLPAVSSPRSLLPPASGAGLGAPEAPGQGTGGGGAAQSPEMAAGDGASPERQR